MAVRTIELAARDGSGDGWTAKLLLRRYAERELVVDATRLLFATPTFLLRLRSFVDWHCSKGRAVRLLGPRDPAVGNYMARMRMGSELPDNASVDLPVVREHEQGDVLVPITRLQTAQDVDRFNEEVAPVISAQVEDVAVLEDALSMAIGELCGNAVEHGRNPLGCYVAVQRYSRSRKTVLAIGDLGQGVPKRIRSCFPEVETDPEALKHALREGVTTTGQPSRGLGFYWVMDAARESGVRSAKLDIRAGRARVVRRLSTRASMSTSATAAPNKIGTWVTFELGPKA
jgi:anti-sigma regulatory factor (Ser/Thr protein kinase)